MRGLDREPGSIFPDAVGDRLPVMVVATDR